MQPSNVKRLSAGGRLLAVTTILSLTVVASLGAQSGVILGNGDDLLRLLDDGGNVAVVFDVNDVNTTQVVRFGRADPSGFDEMNIDIELIDEGSTLAADDRSIFLDSSAANITLGSGSSTEPGSDGDLFLEDGLGTTNILIDGATGNFTQNIDNTGTTFDFDGNGAVKAWAIIESDGTVARCWKCSGAASNTSQVDTGQYQVGFNLNGIENRPVLATVSCPVSSIGILPAIFQCAQAGATINVAPRLFTDSAYFVFTRDSAGTPSDRAFTLVVF